MANEGDRIEQGPESGRAALNHPLAGRPWLIWVLAVATPLATAFALIPSRGHLSAANDALIFVVVTVAIASSGNRWAAALAALASAAAFDFFLTRPYQSFQIRDRGDLTTEFLFVLVGLLVGDIAARGRSYRQSATERRRGLHRILGVGEQIAGGEDPEFVLMSVATQLGELLDLQDCRFVRRPPSEKGAWIEPDGTVRLNPIRWPTATYGLPTDRVELPVRGGGETIGTFILTPTPTLPISRDQCIVAVALADQLGAALATQHGQAT
jgi:K+-sensing histidine kinase KdpD